MQMVKSKLSPLKAWKHLTEKPVTLSSHEIFTQPRKASDRYRGFHINHQDKCTGCGTCSEICPTEAIKLIEVEGREAYSGRTNMLPSFDYGRCSFCGLCIDICTSDSLNMTKEYIHISTDLDTFIFMPDALGIHGVYHENGYTRDKNSELLDLEQYEVEEIPIEGRNQSFIELVRGYSKERAIAEASRCVECGICTDACPAHMNVPEYIKAIYEDRLDDGLELLYETNPLPNICGRICTHKCETACALSNRGEAVSIRWLKRYIVDNVIEKDYQERILKNSAYLKMSGQSTTIKRVAIVGSGPAGLSAAYYLRTLGYRVTVFEAKPLAGGVIRYGAPEYRLPDRAVSKDIQVIQDMGVEIKTSTPVGKDIRMIDLQENYDAVFIATGFWLPKSLNIKNNIHKDIKYSTEFLADCRNYTGGLSGLPDIHKNTIVIGGGDVSFDVARSLVRLQNDKFGSNNVQFIARKDEMHLAASLDEVIEARLEDVHYNLNSNPYEIVIDKVSGDIKGVKVYETTTVIDTDGKVKTTVNKKKSRLIEGTQVYFAVGSTPDLNYLTQHFEQFLKEEIELDRAKIKVNEKGQVEGQPWLFAGGDIVNGPDIISAIADGHNAAKGIDDYLSQKSSVVWISPML